MILLNEKGGKNVTPGQFDSLIGSVDKIVHNGVPIGEFIRASEESNIKEVVIGKDVSTLVSDIKSNKIKEFEVRAAASNERLKDYQVYAYQEFSDNVTGKKPQPEKISVYNFDESKDTWESLTPGLRYVFSQYEDNPTEKQIKDHFPPESQDDIAEILRQFWLQDIVVSGDDVQLNYDDRILADYYSMYRIGLEQPATLEDRLGAYESARQNNLAGTWGLLNLKPLSGIVFNNDVIIDREIEPLKSNIQTKDTPETISIKNDLMNPEKQSSSKINKKIPDWIKSNAEWWSQDQIDDSTFVSGIQFLIKDDIIQIPETITSEQISDEIPNWIKSNAEWWSQDQIDDSTFVSGIQFLIKDDIIQIPETITSEQISDEIPNWIKSNAEWWSQGLISDDDFVKGIQYLVGNGVIRVS